MEKILVVIPCYNCEIQIKRVLDEITPDVAKIISKILILDNGSIDQTVQAAYAFNDKFGDKLIVAKNSENYNLGGSQKLGFDYGINQGFDYVVILHGDNQASSKEIIPIFKIIQKSPNLGAVLGSRFLKESILINYELKRIFGNKILNFIYTLLLGKKISDLGSGLNIYRTSALKKIDFSKCDNQLHFNMDFLIELVNEKIEFSFMPILWREEDQISNAKIWRVGTCALKNILKWKLGIEKPKIKKAYSFIQYEGNL